MIARVFTGLVWVAVLASAGFWGWRLQAPAGTASRAAAAAEAPAFAQADLGRLLGAPPVSAAAPVEPEAATRFRLSGVVASRAPVAASAPATPGVAVLAFDGRMARAYQVGDKVGAGWVLQAVGPRSVTLGQADGASAFTLAVPPRAGEAAAPSAALPRPPATPITTPVRPRLPAVRPPPPQADAVPGQEFVETPEQGQNVAPTEPEEPAR